MGWKRPRKKHPKGKEPRARPGWTRAARGRSAPRDLLPIPVAIHTRDHSTRSRAARFPLRPCASRLLPPLSSPSSPLSRWLATSVRPSRSSFRGGRRETGAWKTKGDGVVKKGRRGRSPATPGAPPRTCHRRRRCPRSLPSASCQPCLPSRSRSTGRGGKRPPTLTARRLSPQGKRGGGQRGVSRQTQCDGNEATRDVRRRPIRILRCSSQRAGSQTGGRGRFSPGFISPQHRANSLRGHRGGAATCESATHYSYSLTVH